MFPTQTGSSSGAEESNRLVPPSGEFALIELLPAFQSLFEQGGGTYLHNRRILDCVAHRTIFEVNDTKVNDKMLLLASHLLFTHTQAVKTTCRSWCNCTIKHNTASSLVAVRVKALKLVSNFLLCKLALCFPDH